jgi:hypothetical protein
MLYVDSNGYINFDWGDSAFRPEYANHFSQPRVSMLHADLNPSQYADGDTDADTDSDRDLDREYPDDMVTARNADGGMDTDGNVNEYPISTKELDDRMVVTYNNVSRYGERDSNTFQIELFYDGAIRITWLRVDLTYGLVGLSQGEGIPPNFFESDLSAYGACKEAGCENGAECDDGSFCNGEELCIDKTCVGGAAPVCDDGIHCTEDSCDETEQACVNTPDNVLCEDGNECTEDFCTPDLGCEVEVVPGCCGNGTCDGEENTCTCVSDCGEPAESEDSLCDDEVDNDCDGLIDSDDDDCGCSADWNSCNDNTDCCSGICKGRFFKRCQPKTQCKQIGLVCVTAADCCSNQCRQYRFFKRCA